MAPLCLLWSVWKERNRLAFRNKEFSLQRLKYSFVCNLWSWVKVSLVLSPSSLVSFLDWIDSKGRRCVYYLHTLRALVFGVSSFRLIYFLLSIKKKKNQ